MKKSIKMLSMAIIVLLISSTTFAQTKKGTEEVKIKTSAVCGMCKDRIEQNIAYEKGVKDVVLNSDTKVVTIKYNATKTNPDQLRAALSKLGYDADNVKADTKAYKALPSCCKKSDDPSHTKH